jgi:flagella basal body P-ring formation protein FlgA
MTTRLLLFTAFSGLAYAGCLPVTGNRIVGRDLALANPLFAALPSTLTIGIAPAPGSKRVFPAAELQRLARANGIQVNVTGDTCFEIPMVRVREEDAIAAMLRALPAGAELKVVEMAKFDVPLGELEFPLQALEPPGVAPGVASQGLSPAVQLWRGYVKYAETRKAPYWARVAVTVRRSVVVAGTDLPLNTTIKENSLRIETTTGMPDRALVATRIEEVRGRALTRSVKAGSVIPLSILADLPTIRRGDPVTVEVQSGSARLMFDAVAEGAAREGEMVELRNPASGKTFKARANRGSKASVTLAEGQRL